MYEPKLKNLEGLGGRGVAMPVSSAPDQELKRGLIASEFAELQQAIRELEDIVGALNKQLQPILLEREAEPTGVAKPEPALPPLGDGLRGLRSVVCNQVHTLRRLHHSIEL